MNEENPPKSMRVVGEKPAGMTTLQSLLKTRPSRGSVISITVAVLISVVSILASAHFRRTPPAPPPEMRDVKVEKGHISIASGAPQWDMLTLGRAVPSTERWTDAAPAEIRVDESLAARIGAP